MRKLAALAVLALLAFFPARGAAQSVSGAQDIPEASTLVKVSAGAVQVPAGGTATARVTLTIAPGWHVNANPPALDYLIPTVVEATAANGLAPGKSAYPPPHKAKLSFEDTELLVYDGSAVVEVPIAAAAGATPGPRTLSGKVKFQSCNDQVCLAPASVPFTIAVTVTPGGTTNAAPAQAAPDRARPAPTGGFATAPPAGGAPADDSVKGRLERALAAGGAVWLLALFVGGLLLNLTPCVFPMLGVTVSIFGARRQEPLPKVLTAAVLYVLGICVMYSALGVIAALTGGLFGAALQSAWVNVGLGALLIVLSLSMFGLYEMQPPAWLLQRLGGADTTSAIGLFLSGLAVGVIAAPCIGPFVVAVLAIIARRGSVAFGFETMFALSLGLGFPYLFLAAFSNLLQRLPRSGEWMVWVKKAFGFVMVSVGLFYVLIALKPSWTVAVLPWALIVAGATLGFLEKSGSASAAFRRFKLAAGVLAIGAGVWLIASAPKTGVVFRPFDPKELESGLASGRTAMIDFSADWCAPCRELEHTTLTDARVKSMAEAFLLYHVDLTHYDSPEAEALRKQYRINGVPTLVFLAPDGQEVWQARVEGFIPPDPLLERMRYVTAHARRPAP